MPQIQANGIEIYYELQGEGPPLTLIEGIGYASWMWFRQVGPLSASHQVLVFDNRGVGKSEEPGADYTLRDMADDLAGLLDALAIGKTHILGISMGGMIAQEFALSHPNRLDRLVLASTLFGGQESVPVPVETAKLMVPDTTLPPAGRIKKAMAPAFAPGWAEAYPEVVDAIVFMRLAVLQPPEAWVRQAKAVAAFDASARLGEIKAPTLILHGDQDRVVPVENARLIAERMPGANLRIFSGGGHLVHVEQADGFNQTVLDFLR